MNWVVMRINQQNPSEHHGGAAPPQAWPGEFHILSNIKIVQNLLVLTKVIYSYERKTPMKVYFEVRIMTGGEALVNPHMFPGNNNIVITP